MSRGTWQGSGTFQTSQGPGPLPIILVVAVLAVLGSGAAARAAKDLITILIIGAVIVVVAVAATAFLIWRLTGSRLVFRSPPPPEAVTPAVTPQVAASMPPASIENHYHGPSIHIHGGGHEEAASLIRKALTEGKPEP